MYLSVRISVIMPSISWNWKSMSSIFSCCWLLFYIWDEQLLLTHADWVQNRCKKDFSEGQLRFRHFRFFTWWEKWSWVSVWWSSAFGMSSIPSSWASSLWYKYLALADLTTAIAWGECVITFERPWSERNGGTAKHQVWDCLMFPEISYASHSVILDWISFHVLFQTALRELMSSTVPILSKRLLPTSPTTWWPLTLSSVPSNAFA